MQETVHSWTIVPFGEGMLMISKAYLSAEQAAKTNKTIFESILSNIENGNIRDKKKSLPEVYGITGKQMKFLLRIYQGVCFISLVKDRCNYIPKKVMG